MASSNSCGNLSDMEAARVPSIQLHRHRCDSLPWRKTCAASVTGPPAHLGTKIFGNTFQPSLELL
eukprot:7302349-Lingulodinium_polyedra.AAC.1